LIELARPNIEVEKFEQALRLELMRTANAHKPARPGFQALLSWSLTGVFGVMAVMFVIRPDVAARLNRVLGGPNHSAGGLELAGASEPLRPVVDHAATTLYDSLLHDERLTVDADKAFVANWAAQRFPNRPPAIEGVTQEGLYAVRRFSVSGGKQVLVFTSLEPEEPLSY